MSIYSAQERYDAQLPPEDPPDNPDEIILHLKDLLDDPEIPTLLRRRAERQLLELEY